MTLRKKAIKEFEETINNNSVALKTDPKFIIKKERAKGKISEYAANDLFRLIEVMDEYYQEY